MHLPLWQCHTKNMALKRHEAQAASEKAMPHNTAASRSPSRGVSQTRDRSRLAKGGDEFPPEQVRTISNDAGPRKRVGMPDSGGDKAASIPPDSSMNVGQQKIILKVQLSRAMFFPCAKNGRVELMLQHIIIFILPYPRSFPQHSTYYYRQPSGDLGAKERAARLTQSA